MFAENDGVECVQSVGPVRDGCHHSGKKMLIFPLTRLGIMRLTVVIFKDRLNRKTETLFQNKQKHGK